MWIFHITSSFPISISTNILNNPTARYKPIIQSNIPLGNNSAGSVYLSLLILEYGIIINRLVLNS